MKKDIKTKPTNTKPKILEKAIKTQADCRNIQISDSAILYLILSLLGLNIVSIALVQNDLNIVIRNNKRYWKEYNQ